VHRDLKAENIMISWDGQVKVMDFGLARLLGSTHVTAPGSLVGTFAYMSPEQINQEEVNARSDIFSFGILLYEMLTGELPFKGATIGEILSAILTREPRPMRSISPEVPEHLERIVNRLLRKNPADRYASMHEVLTDMEHASVPAPVRRGISRIPARVVTVASIILLAAIAVFVFLRWPAAVSTPETPASRTIAVLPFVNLDHDPNLEYLQIGLADDIITRLSFVRTLTVRPTSAVVSYEGKDVGAEQAGTDLRTDYVVEGRFQTASDKLTLMIQLVSVEAHRVIWGEKIEVPQSELATLEDNLARRVVDALSIPLTKTEDVQVQRMLTADPEAYEFYLRGIALTLRGSRDNIKAAMGMFERAVGLDPYFAEAYASLSSVYVEYFWSNYTSDTSWVVMGEEMARQALAIDEGLASAHASLGYALRVKGQYRESMHEAVRAMNLDPKLTFPMEELTEYYRNRGEFDSALAYTARIALQDPTFNLERVKARILQFKGDYRGSIPLLKRAVERSPKDAWLRGGLLATSYLRIGDLASAEREIAASRLIDDEKPEPRITKAMLETVRGNLSQAEKELAGTAKYTLSDYGLAYLIAAIYARQGNRERALEWTERATTLGNRWYSGYEGDDWFDSIRNEPRFQNAMTSIRAELDSVAVDLKRMKSDHPE
jgi:TolB-like protein/Flp pilus assembly protein TadD